MTVRLPAEVPLGRVAGETQVLTLGSSGTAWRSTSTSHGAAIPAGLLFLGLLVPVVALLFLKPRRPKRRQER
jgi:hypothetical protein